MSASTAAGAARRRYFRVLLAAAIGAWGLFLAGTVIYNRDKDFSRGFEAETLPDYVVFYSAGRLVLDGRGDELYDLDAMGREESEVAGVAVEGEDVLPYFNPPFLAALFAPLTLLPLEGFALLLTAVNLALLLASGVWLQRLLSPRDEGGKAAFWLAYALSYPVLGLFINLQVTLLVAVALLAFVHFQERRREGLAGGALALALVKPQFAVLPALFLLYNRRWAALLPLAAVAGGLVLVSAAVSGPAVLVDYPRFLTETTRWAGNGVFGENMYGWQGLLADLTGDATPPRPLFLGLALPTLAVAWWRMRRPWPQTAGALPGVMAVALLGTLLAAPHLYAHDLLLVTLAVLFAGVQAVREGGSLGPWWAAALGFWLLGMARLAGLEAPLPSAAMVVLFAALIWRGAPGVGRRRDAGLRLSPAKAG